MLDFDATGTVAPVPCPWTEERARALWLAFRNAFLQTTSTVPVPELHDAWGNQRKRTALYTDILERVAGLLELKLQVERFNIDFLLSQELSDGPWVPGIVLESENASWSATEEVEKLAWISAPVRVLLTVAEWDAAPGVWGGGQSESLLKDWQRIVGMSAQCWRRDGVLGFIVGEHRPHADGELRFWCFAMDGRGEMLEAPRPLLKMPLSPGGDEPLVTA